MRFQLRAILLLSSLVLPFQAKAQTVNAEYDRTSLTIIQLSHHDRYDASTADYLKNHNPGGEKFDATRIPATALNVSFPRFVKTDENNAGQYLNSHQADVYSLLAASKAGLQVIGAWFNRSPEGVMDLNVINSRSEYNASDQTYNIAKAQALGEYLIHGEGIRLVDNSYILVVDHSEPVRQFNKDSDGKTTGVSWSTTAMGWLFKVNFDDALRQKVYDLWIYDDDSPEKKAEKIAAWQELEVGLSFVKSDHVTSSGSKSISEKDQDDSPALAQAITGCSSALISSLEKNVEAWKVKSTVYKTHPISSKIGKKEGLGNLSRFEVREYILGDDGKVSTRHKAYVRATKVSDNTKGSRKDIKPTEFYQISGGRIQSGMLLKQKKSANLDVKALYYGGASAGYGLELDVLSGMKTWGGCGHFRLAGTYNTYSEEDVTAVAVRLGYGYGVRPFRALEIIPGAYLLGDMLSPKSKDDAPGDGSKTSKRIGWGAEAGIDANLTIWYPVKVNAGAFYTLPLIGGSEWQTYRDKLDIAGKSRRGLSFRLGLVYEF